MKDLFHSIPKPVLALLIMFVAAVFAIYSDPPKTVCDIQQEVFSQNMAGKLFPVKGKTGTRPALWDRAREECKAGNSAGACFKFFEILRSLTVSLGHVPTECLSQVMELPQASGALDGGLTLLVQLAWGEGPRGLSPSRHNWFENYELDLFCKMKSSYLRAYSEDAWVNFREKTFHSLEGAKRMSPEDIWARSLFSINCDVL